jgi:periplasmic protein TonB
VFTESLLESSAHSRRGLSTILSFALQTVAIAALVLLPLFYTQALPGMVALGPLIGPPPGERAHAALKEQRSTRASTTEMIGNTVQEPIQIRKGVAEIHDQTSPEPNVNNGFAVPGATGSGEDGSQIMSLLPPPPRRSALPPSPATRPVSISGGVSQGLLIQQVRPAYPALAIAARVQGPVVLVALISRAGTIENLRLVSGPPMLVQAAIEAIRQWRYRPYLLNGEPVEVETQITVNFTLGDR